MLDQSYPGPALLRETADEAGGASGRTGQESMVDYVDNEHDKARRFRDAALPYLDDAYALARYLLRNAADAEDAVQECYLRAFRHFDSYRGPAMKPWLLTILRNVYNAEFERRGRQGSSANSEFEAKAEDVPLWQEPSATPESKLVRQHDDATIRRLVAAFRPSRRSFFSGFGAGAVLSGALAASLVLTIFRNDQDQAIANDVVSAHIRSLQANHLMDVETSDQHTVKPWFDGKVDVAPPVIDLTTEGFTLLGGRLDYIDGEPVASVVYRRRKHIINLFVAQHLGAAHAAITAHSVEGYNVRHWSEQGLEFWAVSDLDSEELGEFVQKISVAVRPNGASS